MPADGFSVRDMDSRCDIRFDFDSEADFCRAGFLPCGFVYFCVVFAGLGGFEQFFAVNLLNKNKKSVPGRICVYVCSTQPRALCLYSFKDIN